MPSREATPLIWIDLGCTDSKILSKLCPQVKPPLLSGQIYDALIVKYFVNYALNGSHPLIWLD